MIRLASPLVLFVVAGTASSQFDGFEGAPINYKTAATENAITALQARIDSGKTKLPFVEDHGYLPALLKELNVPRSSQVLVFSKTSFQRERITPKTPRALYFNDDVYVGFCLRGDVLEVSAVDMKLGTAFYTLDQQPEGTPRFQRQHDNCLVCHASTATGGVPGHLLRSVFPDRLGLPILSAGSFRTDHSSPLKERWGGWYVTGIHGPQEHMGNWVVENRRDPESEGNAKGQNVTDLRSRFTVGNYLTPHSDIVALMVLEHQAHLMNLLTRLGWETRAADYEMQTGDSSLLPPGRASFSFDRAVTEIVDYLLFVDEAPLPGPVEGTSGFAEEFMRRGPFDRRGRSLRQLDLERRLMRYPCSYVIYSPVFDELPDRARDAIYRRLWQVLGGNDQSGKYSLLSENDRTAIVQILRETKPGLPEYFR
jgi:hypothetical protein